MIKPCGYGEMAKLPDLCSQLLFLRTFYAPAVVSITGVESARTRGTSTHAAQPFFVTRRRHSPCQQKSRFCTAAATAS